MFEQQPIRFDGGTYDEARDGKRLQAQLSAVRALMSDGLPHTLDEVSKYAQCSTASASARVRDLRKRRHGSHTVTRNYLGNGVWEYRMALHAEQTI